MTTFEQVKQIILQEDYKIYPEEVVEDAHLKNDLGLDSIDKVSIAMRCENKFNIAMPDEKLEEIQTVINLVNCIESIMKK